MASACVNPPPPPNLLDSPPSWFSPRISFSHDFVLNQDPTKSPRNGDLDFEFSLGEICSGKNFSPADELFSDGKLMPLDLTSIDNKIKIQENQDCAENNQDLKECEEKIIINEIFEKNEASPKAPKCSWKEFLGLKRSQNPNILQKSSDSLSYTAKSSKSLKFFLHRNSKSSNSSSMNHPLLKDVDIEGAESMSISARRSLSSSSSSSGHDHEDIPRLSLDSDKPKLPKLKLTKPKLQKASTARSTRPARVGRSAARRAPEAGSRGVSVDSPRMNSSGKIVFSSLERSSSSPSTFNGAPRLKARGMERSYSANVRIRPVLNVPMCSLRGSSSGKSGSVFGFGQLFSSQKKDTKHQSIKRNGSGNNSFPMARKRLTARKTTSAFTRVKRERSPTYEEYRERVLNGDDLFIPNHPFMIPALGDYFADHRIDREGADQESYVADNELIFQNPFGKMMRISKTHSPFLMPMGRNEDMEREVHVPIVMEWEVHAELVNEQQVPEQAGVAPQNHDDEPSDYNPAFSSEEEDDEFSLEEDWSASDSECEIVFLWNKNQRN